MRKIIVVKVLLFDKQGQLLLVRRSKTAPRRPLEWDFPGGFVDDEDESFQHAALREVAEETGLKVQDNHLELAFAESDKRLSGDEMSDVSWLYFKGVVKDRDVNLSFEHDRATWVSLQEASELIKYDTQLRAIAYLQR